MAAGSIGVELELMPMLLGFLTYKGAVIARGAADLFADLTAPAAGAPAPLPRVTLPATLLIKPLRGLPSSTLSLSVCSVSVAPCCVVGFGLGWRLLCHSPCRPPCNCEATLQGTAACSIGTAAAHSSIAAGVGCSVHIAHQQCRISCGGAPPATTALCCRRDYLWTLTPPCDAAR